VAGPSIEVSAGYMYFSLEGPPSHRMGLNGVNADGIMEFNRHWGATADVSYAHGKDAFGTPHSANVISGLVGPVYYLMQRPRLTIFVHALAGMAFVDSAVPISTTEYLGGWENRFSYAFGGAVEHVLTGPFAVRVSEDYQHTTFVNSTGASQGENDLRLTGSVVYRF